VSPTRAEHVRDEFGEAVRVIMDGGECKLGLESTIVDCSGEVPRLLRPGSITLSRLRTVVPDIVVGATAETPRVPGSDQSHYAPVTPLQIVPGGELDQLAGKLSEGGQRIAVLAQRLPLRTHKFVTWVNAGTRQEAFAHDLYANLRSLDKAGTTRILVQEVPGEEKWDAVRDRLQRAAVISNDGESQAMAAGILP
jgi:L-threonylcarbamoyladenylate synthase